MKKRRVCILSFSNIAWDARVLREIDAASRIYEVDVIGYGAWQPPEGVRFIPVPKTKDQAKILPPNIFLILLGRLNNSAWEQNYWRKVEYRQAVEIIRSGNYDLIHANDWDALPVAATAAQGSRSRILFDAHEFTPEQGIDNARAKLRIPYLVFLLKKYIGEVSQIITVGEGIADLYRAHFQWDSQVVMNAPFYQEYPFRAIQPDRINLVHHGGALRSRYIEDMIFMMGRLEHRFHLNLMLLPSEPRYMKYLMSEAEKLVPGRVTFIKPVPPAEILNVISRYDLGIPLMKVRTKSYFHSLPNKFFDFVMAGLGIAVTPLPDMQKVVESSHNGIVSSDQTWQSMAAVLNALTADEINTFKRNSLFLAQSLNAEKEMEKLMKIYADIISEDGATPAWKTDRLSP